MENNFFDLKPSFSLSDIDKHDNLWATDWKIKSILNGRKGVLRIGNNISPTFWKINFDVTLTADSIKKYLLQKFLNIEVNKTKNQKNVEGKIILEDFLIWLKQAFRVQDNELDWSMNFAGDSVFIESAGIGKWWENTIQIFDKKTNK